MAKRNKKQRVSPSFPASVEAKCTDNVRTEPVLNTYDRYSSTRTLMTSGEACVFLGGISKSTLRRLEKSGVIGGRIVLGRLVRYDSNALEESLLNLRRSSVV